MNETHYLFALYVFLLVCGVIWFYSRTVGKAKTKDKKGYDREQRLFILYQEIEDMLKGFELYVEEAKAEIDARLKQAQPQPQDQWASVVEHALSQAPGKTMREEQPEDEQRDEPEPFFLAPSNALEDVIVELSQKRPREPQAEQPREPEQEKGVSSETAAASEPQPAEESSPRPVRAHRKRRVTRIPAPPMDARSTKEMVLEYAAKGMDQREIARLLGISSREVALILELKKIAPPPKES